MVFLLQLPTDLFYPQATYRGICVGSALGPCKAGRWDQAEASHSQFHSMLGL